MNKGRPLVGLVFAGVFGMAYAACGGDGASPLTPSDASFEAEANDSEAAFSEDFDRGALKPGWFMFGELPSISAANVLRVITPNTPDANIESRIARDIPSGTTEWTLEASVRIESVGVNTGSPEPPVLLQMTLPSAAGLLVMQVEPGERAFCSGLDKRVGSDMPFSYGEWHRVVMKLTKKGESVAMSCKVDTLPTRTSQAPGTLATSADIRVGLFAFRGQGALDVLYDDVVFRSR
jgi:hypothetical protein